MDDRTKELIAHFDKLSEDALDYLKKCNAQARKEIFKKFNKRLPENDAEFWEWANYLFG